VASRLPFDYLCREMCLFALGPASLVLRAVGGCSLDAEIFRDKKGRRGVGEAVSHGKGREHAI
jgi:hypothetical protein